MSGATLELLDRYASALQLVEEIATSAPDAAQVLERLAERIGAVVMADGAVMEVVEGDELVYHATAGTLARHVGARLPVAGSLSGRAIDEVRTLVCDDVETDPRVNRAATRALDIRSMVVCPLIEGGRGIGVLKVAASRPRAFGAHHVAVLELIARVASARLDDALTRQRAAEAERLLEIRRWERDAGLAALEEGVFYRTREGQVTVHNDAALRILGLSEAQLGGREPLDPRWVVIREDGTRWPIREQPSLTAIATGEPTRGAVMGVDVPDEGLRWLSVSAVPVLDETGEVVGAFSSFRDVTAEREQAAALERQRRLLDEAQRLAHLGSWEWDAAGGTRWTDTLYHLLDLPPGTPAAFSRFLERVHGDDLAAVEAAVGAALTTGGTFRIEHRIAAPDGTTPARWLSSAGEVTLGPDGRPQYAWGTCQDVTDRLQEREALELAASTDPLTGLGNRTALEARVAGELAALAGGGDGSLALLLVDLDHFKQVNDSLGHQAGDAVLVECARRLRQICRPGDLVARLGGDEFAVVSPGMPDAASAERLAGRLVAALTGIDPGGAGVQAGASIGTALAGPADVTDGFAGLYRRADAALYAAKQAGRGRSVQYA